MNQSQGAQERAKRIRILLLDVDGVLTDGKLYFSNDGSEIKAFNTLDGHGIKLLQKSGVRVGIITGRTSQLVAKRAADLGVTLLIQGREDKFQAMLELLNEENYELDEIAFMGDDYPDLQVICRVGLGMTVANALQPLVDNTHWQSQFRGGEGAVREACDFIMQAQGTYEAALAGYLTTVK